MVYLWVALNWPFAPVVNESSNEPLLSQSIWTVHGLSGPGSEGGMGWTHAPGDYVRLEMPYGTFVYRAYKHRVVVASDLSVLRSPDHEVLELQACHPRFFATHRYIVYARLVSVQPRGGPPYAPKAFAAGR